MALQRDRSYLAHSSCLGEHQPKHLPNTHTDTHTRDTSITLKRTLMTRLLMKPTRIMIAQVSRYRNEKPPPVDWAIYLSLLETRVA